jgi:glycosyltransferase involved in cell wall biosynthesis
MADMKTRLITYVPVYNGAEFIVQTLQSIAEQTLKPDRVIVQDNLSTDKTEELVKGFKPLKCEWQQNPKNLGWLGNANRGLDYSTETDYLHILCADDVIRPAFYQRLIEALDSCDGYGLGYTLDERIDENNERLSISGSPTGQVEIQPQESFLKEKAEIANQAISASLLKTAYQKPACRFNPDFPSLADMIFWGEWGSHCKKIVRVHDALAAFRWHGANNSDTFVLNLQDLVLDEWRVMQFLEKLRGATPSFIREFKLRGLFAVRSGIKAKRFRQMNNPGYADQIIKASRNISGPLAWYMGQAVVEARDIAVYKILGRPRHRKNIFS